MKWRTLKFVVLVALAANISFFGFTCAMDLTIENQSDQNLTVYHNGILEGNVGPGQSITSETVFGAEYRITALNTEGEVVFAKRFSLENLIELDDLDRKAVIPADITHKGVTTADLIIENKSDMVLTILVEDRLVGDASPGESVTATNLPSPYLPENKEINYHVVANNAQDQRIFGEDLDLSKLEITDFKTLKVVIEPFYKEITFRNKTETSVIVFVNFHKVGEIKPGETVKKNVPIYSDFVRITAKDTQGNFVYYSNWNNVSWEFRDKKWEEVITLFGD